MQKRWILGATVLLVVGGALAFAKTRASNVEPLSKSDAALTKCEVHGVALQTEDVPIMYGLMGAMPGFYEAQKRAFPHASSVVMGGCIVSDNSPKFQTVKFCPQCRVAQKRWVSTSTKKR